jgi:hypothetical protein
MGCCCEKAGAMDKKTTKAKKQSVAIAVYDTSGMIRYELLKKCTTADNPLL